MTAAIAERPFLQGAPGTYTAGIVAILAGATIVFLRFPKHGGEDRLLAEYQAEDTG